MTSGWPALAALGVLCAVEAREARGTVAAVASLGRGAAARAGVSPGLTLVAVTGVMVAALALLPRTWAEAAGGVAVLVAGLQWLLWAGRRETGAVPPRDEGAVYDAVRRRISLDGTAIGGAAGPALLRAGAEAVVVATAVAASAGPNALWLPPVALLLVTVAVAPGLAGCRPATPGPCVRLPERPAKAVIAVLLTAQGAAGVTGGAVGVPLAVLLSAAGLLVLTAYGRLSPRSAEQRAPGQESGAGRALRRRALRDFVVGDDLAVWWAVAALLLTAHLPRAGLGRVPAALLLTAVLAALLGRTARRPRIDHSGGDH